MDPGHNDILTFFGFPLVGGSNQLPSFGLIGGGLLQGANLATFLSPIYYDAFMPWIQYVQKDGDLYVVNLINSLFDVINPSAEFDELKGVMVAANYEGPRKAFFGGEYAAPSAGRRACRKGAFGQDRRHTRAGRGGVVTTVDKREKLRRCNGLRVGVRDLVRIDAPQNLMTSMSAELATVMRER